MVSQTKQDTDPGTIAEVLSVSQSKPRTDTIRLSDLNTLHQAGLVPGERYAEAAYQIKDHAFWSTWALRVLMALGTGHVLAGIIFFFAFNWADMSDFAKFAVVQGGIVITVLGALISGLDRPVGQSLLISASVLTGVVLAVFGQIYQTGADAYQLFFSWALLIIPWVLISRNAAHWLVWLIVACIAIGLYCEQILVPLKTIDDSEALLILGAFLSLALAAREVACHLGATWLRASWVRYVVLFPALGCLFMMAVWHVLDFHVVSLSTLAFLIALSAGLIVYRFVLPDFGAFAISIGFGGFFAMALGGRLMEETIRFDTGHFSILWSLAILTIWCVAVTAGMGRLLILLRHRFKEVQA